MNGLIKSLFVVFVCFTVISCGKKEDSSNKVPQSDNPETTTPAPSTPAPATPTPTPDPRLPNMTGSVSVNLTNKTTYQGLKDLAGNVILPVVGDVKFVMHIPNSRTNIKGSDMLLAFEDNLGFWGASLPSFEGTETLNTSASTDNLDIIFADDETLFHVIGKITNDALTGSIYYRVRTATDPKVSYTLPAANGGSTVQTFNYCTKIEFKCSVTYPYGYSGPTGTNSNTTVCPNQPVIDTATPCKNFMSITDTSVKKLGTFETKYSNWTTLTGD